MKSVKNLFNHRAVQVITFVVVTALAAAGYYVTQVRSASEAPSVTWLTPNNVGAELNISQTASGSVAAAPATPVLLIECPRETCNAADLNLSAAIKQFDGKVKIVAIDPYEQPQLTQALEATFIAPAVQQAVTSQLAVQIAQSKVTNGATLTQADVDAVMQDSNFQSNIKQILADPALMKQYVPQLAALVQPAYAKFFFFSAKTFNIVNAATSVDINTQAELTDFVGSSLSALNGTATTGATADSAGSATSTAGSAPAATATSTGSGK